METIVIDDREYFYLDVERLNPFYWLKKLDKKIYEIDEQNKEEFRQAVFGGIKTVVADWGVVAWKWFVSITPELVGYAAIISGGLMILSPLVNRSITKPLGLFAASGVVGLCVLGVS